MSNASDCNAHPKKILKAENCQNMQGGGKHLLGLIWAINLAISRCGLGEC